MKAVPSNGQKLLARLKLWTYRWSDQKQQENNAIDSQNSKGITEPQLIPSESRQTKNVTLSLASILSASADIFGCMSVAFFACSRVKQVKVNIAFYGTCYILSQTSVKESILISALKYFNTQLTMSKTII